MKNGLAIFMARTRMRMKALFSAMTHFVAREQTKMFKHGQCESQVEGKWWWHGSEEMSLNMTILRFE